VQASVSNRFTTEPFEFVSEVQHAALEISDHRVTSRTIEQSIRNFVFEDFLPPFEIKNMVRFRHDIFAI
jgi:hypothetical protein